MSIAGFLVSHTQRDGGSGEVRGRVADAWSTGRVDGV